MKPAPYTLTPPLGAMSPLVVEVPHASTWLAPEHLALLNAPARSIVAEADLYVDELYARAPEFGATLVVGGVSRLALDLNRDKDDIDSEVIEDAPRKRGSNQGCLWKLTSDGRYVHTRKLLRGEWQLRVDSIYRPYHSAVAEALRVRHAKFGFAVLLCAHSMPSTATAADVVPGTRGGQSCAPALTSLVMGVAAAAGLRAVVDTPYLGGYGVRHYGKPSAGVHAIQVELSRRLYMHEAQGTRGGQFERLQAWCTELCGQMSRLSLDQLGEPLVPLHSYVGWKTAPD